MTREMVRRLSNQGASLVEAWREFTAHGLTGVRAPEEWGGVAMDVESLLVVVHETARVRPDWAAALVFHNHSAIMPLSFCDLSETCAEVAASLGAGLHMGKRPIRLMDLPSALRRAPS